jgi:hypothetical protein
MRLESCRQTDSIGHVSLDQLRILEDWYCYLSYKTPRSVVQLLTTVADWLHHLTFVFVTNLARIKNYLKNSILHVSGVLHYLT